MTRGEEAEHLVHDRLRAALPDDVRIYANVCWIARSRPGGPAHEGEADLVLVHPESGILVIEVKAGEPSRDHEGRWFIGPIPLDRSPFQQPRTASTTS